jgi:hypothetical protein
VGLVPYEFCHSSHSVSRGTGRTNHGIHQSCLYCVHITLHTGSSVAYRASAAVYCDHATAVEHDVLHECAHAILEYWHTADIYCSSFCLSQCYILLCDTVVYATATLSNQPATPVYQHADITVMQTHCVKLLC